MKAGDIFLNTYASENNPVRTFIVMSENGKTAYCKCEDKGKLMPVRYYANDIRNDTEHFKKIGHLDLSKIIIDKLKELKGGEGDG